MTAGTHEEALIEAAKRFRAARNAYLDSICGTPVRLNRHGGQAALAKGVRFFLGYCALVRALKGCRSFFKTDNSVAILVLPRTWSLEDMEAVAEICLGYDKRSAEHLNVFSHPTERNKKRSWDFCPQSQLNSAKVLILCQDGCDLHPEIEAAADDRVTLNLSPDRDLNAVCRLRRMPPPSAADCAFLRGLPSTYLEIVFRKSRHPAPVIERVRKIVTRSKNSPKTLPIDVFGDISEWARHLKADLGEWQMSQLPWSDIEKGILLYGPPGTGKTSFAASLAAFLDVPLVACSLARWQSAGHLGDLLRSMYSDFERAKSQRPSILFIDEMDALGDRQRFSGDNAQYCNEVVNALLEAIDGSISREGVILIGASNHPDRIDSALLRPGRLERHFRLSLPDKAGRLRLASFYLPEFESPEIEVIAERFQGMTAADIEYCARRARQRARQHRRKISVQDMYAELPQEFVFDEDDHWRVCVHEAGHAVVAKALGVGRILSVQIQRTGPDGPSDFEDAFGYAQIDTPRKLLKTETAMRNDLAVSLAGMAAEELLVGDRSSVSAGSKSSDLVQATQLAVRMVSHYGLGRSPQVIYSIRPATDETDLLERLPHLRKDVDDLLSAQYQRAKTLLQQHQSGLINLARTLREEKHLSEPRIAHMLSEIGGPALTTDATVMSS